MAIAHPLNVLVVDDEASMRSVCEGFIRSFGHNVVLAENAEQALQQLQDVHYDLVVADYKLPGMDGLELLERIKQDWPQTEVIIMTAYADVSSAVQAIRHHAFDYLPKPFELEDMQRAVKQLERIKHLTIENVRLRQQLRETYSFDQLVGTSEAVQEIRRLARRASEENFPVLIQGENGTGKEMIAKIIHFNSHRAANPFVPIDCSAINPGSYEAELFGSEKGVGTGLPHIEDGLLRMADGGTVLFDEVTEIPLDVQVKLLRCLQEQCIRPVGGVNEIKVDIRVIAASSRDVESMAAKGEFSQELFYRLNVVPISVPPLRDRKEDIRMLIAHFIKTKSAGTRKIKGISRDALSAVMDYSWPVNVRELENMVERALALGMSNRIEKEDLPPAVLKAAENPAAHLLATQDDLKPLEEIEKEAILRTLERTGGDKMLAAQVLGIDRSTLYRKLKRF